MVQQLIDKAGAILSKVITDRWNAIFKTRPAGRESVIIFGLVNSEVMPDPYIGFAIREDAPFDARIDHLDFDDSFAFCFYSVQGRRHDSSGTLFLFDEPDSNLHAKAQEKLLESFKDISSVPNRLIYSTHSPYMIEPLWLDDAYVVENTLISEELNEIGEMSVAEESDIVARRYKSYVDEFPDRLDHLQPVIDTLEVKPSMGDIRGKLLTEGKSDYAILRGLMEGKKLKFKIVLRMGSTTPGALVGLLRGWGCTFAVLLNSDDKGREAAERYKKKLALDKSFLIWLT